MPDTRAAKEEHEQLMHLYNEARAQSEAANSKVTRAFFDCAREIGTGPTEAQCALAENLENKTRTRWDEVMQHIRRTFP